MSDYPADITREAAPTRTASSTRTAGGGVPSGGGTSEGAVWFDDGNNSALLVVLGVI